MSLAIVHTRAISGICAVPVRVEADLANGLPNFSIVGLPDTAIREARDRVRAAIQNCGFDFPQRRITINLAPADLPKNSGRFDLAIALGILAASEQLPREALKSWEFFGELSLTGDLLPVRNAFILAAQSLPSPPKEAALGRYFLLPAENIQEALLTESDCLGFAKSLNEVVVLLKNKSVKEIISASRPPTQSHISKHAQSPLDGFDWQDIHGQSRAKRAALIAVAGFHNLLMLGPPGVGKSMIASRLSGLLPRLSHQEACELASIQSLKGPIDLSTWRTPPYRAPHHNTPSRALIGGGQPVQPGEVSLSHRGILFMDELAEFSRDSLEALREPMETGEVSIARVRDRLTLPARFMLVAAMNPCPCGYFGVAHARRDCRCSSDRILRYRSKISGPLMERFDMAVSLDAHPQPTETPGPTSAQLADLIGQCHRRQISRQGVLNARLASHVLRDGKKITSDALLIAQSAATKWGWSMRSMHRCLRVAQTITDLRQSQVIEVTDVSEAIELRRAIDVSLAV